MSAIRPLSALILAIASGASSCGGDQASGAAASTAQTAEFAPTTEAPIVNFGECIDGSKSNDPAVIAAALDVAADVVRRLPVPDPNATGERSPVPGVHVVVRQVSSSSMSSFDDELVNLDIPGIPGLAERPDPSQFESFAENNRLWREAAARSDTLLAEAVSQRQRVLEELSVVTVDSDGSEIAGCLTALRDSFPVGSEVVAAVVSDLDQIGEPQVRGDYSGMTVVIAMTCSDVDRCAHAEDDWRTLLESMAVADVRFVSVSQLADELLKIMEVI